MEASLSPGRPPTPIFLLSASDPADEKTTHSLSRTDNYNRTRISLKSSG